MRIVIIAVGRSRHDPARALYEDYAGRIARSGPTLGVRGPDLREISEARAGSREERISREANAILTAVEPTATLVALDERGQDHASADLARWLATERDRGTQNLSFIIGGADGLDRAVVDRASLVIAFGRQTWPHFLVRALLAEQIYRALTILGRHPYHRS